MIRRFFILLPLLWMLGLAWFALSLPRPSAKERTDGVVVLTGGAGRLDRGIVVLQQGWSKRMLISGVDRSVRPQDLIAIRKVPGKLLKCCITLGKDATNTVSNAAELGDWAQANRMRSIRLITSDWHMRRARMEIESRLGDDISIVPDAIRTAPRFQTILLEYNKFVLRRFSLLIGQ
jgi:uncharacterized SAM-binding protein YcdF (DUF218 family)